MNGNAYSTSGEADRSTLVGTGGQFVAAEVGQGFKSGVGRQLSSLCPPRTVFDTCPISRSARGLGLML